VGENATDWRERQNTDQPESQRVKIRGGGPQKKQVYHFETVWPEGQKELLLIVSKRVLESVCTIFTVCLTSGSRFITPTFSVLLCGATPLKSVDSKRRKL